MSPTREGSFHLCRIAGVSVFVHWSWFAIGIFAVQNRAGVYSGMIWNLYEYLALFAIVLMHEFGHALACKQAGGTANEIVLWPLGGVAYVAPPPRPGAHLWSIAAGPLVNVALAPVFYFIEQWALSSGLYADAPDLFTLIWWVGRINLALLIFNMLPVYPLDGGQILRSLLWFRLGPAKSLFVASIIGFAGVAALGVLALWRKDVWLGVMTAFVFINCQRGWQHARAMMKIAARPKRMEFACPACKEPPPRGEIWVCPRCRTAFDAFATDAVCPNCAAEFPATQCLRCGQMHPIREWRA